MSCVKQPAIFISFLRMWTVRRCGTDKDAGDGRGATARNMNAFSDGVGKTDVVMGLHGSEDDVGSLSVII